MTQTATAVKTEMPSMEERIATMLRAPKNVSAQEFALMLRWVDAKIITTKRDAQEALRTSLDPAVVDPGALGRAHDAEHFLKRLKNAKTALTTHLQAAQRREELEAWQANTADLKQRVTDLSQELLGTYSEAVAKLVDLFKRCDAADREIAQANNRAPRGCQLNSVEATLTNGSATKIIPKVKLPTLSVDGAVGADAWPPPAPNIGLQYYESVRAGLCGPNMMPPTEAERIAESARVIEYAEQMERGRVRLNEQAEARARGIAAGG